MAITFEVLQVVLPTDYSKGNDFHPVIATEAGESAGGVPQEVVLWAGALSRGSISYLKRTEAVRNAVYTIWEVCKLGGKACLFWDHRTKENTGTAEPGLPATGDGSNETFFLRRRLTSAGDSVYKRIYHPIHGALTALVHGQTISNTVVAYVAGIEVPITSVNTATGEVVLVDPPADGAAVTFDFRYLKAVMFDDRNFPDEQIGTFFNISGLRIKEVPG